MIPPIRRILHRIRATPTLPMEILNMDLSTKALPDTITVEGRAYLLNTDFRLWLRFMRELKEAARTQSDLIVNYLFKDDFPEEINIKQLADWAQPKQELPRDLGSESDAIAFDFDIDADLIYSAFVQQYGIDLLEADMHWYKFLALMRGINDSTKLGKIIGYRTYEKSDKKYDDQMNLLRRMWEITPPITPEEQADIDELNSYFD